VLEQGAEYSQVRLSDDYEGYLRNIYFSDQTESTGKEFMVSVTIATAYTRADEYSPAATLLPFTSVIRADKKVNGFIVCKTKRWGDICVLENDLIPPDQIPQLTRKDIPMLLASAKRFIGVPYLWGGKSFFGIDCSGFTQMNYKFFGINLPRDTKDQINAGKEIKREDILPGDLLFFKRHVALAIDSQTYIHSSTSTGGVYINSFDSKQDNYLEHLDKGLIAVRRIIED